ncbi:hypothetical protein QQX98_000718 [Neonectria punicea]|uniref:Uncharacterized protein n=1 Tax=Neonectria punicea TaxID=979145 RepID=A0ABR1HSB6_9HYPO
MNNLFSEYLGHCIAPFDQARHEGTKGLYLRRRDTGQVLALTCRHVVFDDKTPNEDYAYNADNGSRVTILQPGDKTLTDLQSYLPAYIRHAKSTIERLEMSSRTPEAKGAEEFHTTTLLHHEQAEEMLKDLNPPASRIFGHVLFSPKFGITTRGTARQQWLRDWALIELHPGKHTSFLVDLQNKVGAEPKVVSMLIRAMGAEDLNARMTLYVDTPKSIQCSSRELSQRQR